MSKRQRVSGSADDSVVSKNLAGGCVPGGSGAGDALMARDNCRPPLSQLFDSYQVTLYRSQPFSDFNFFFNSVSSYGLLLRAKSRDLFQESAGNTYSLDLTLATSFKQTNIE